MAGISRAAVSLILSEDRQPGPEVCVALAKALGYAPEDVFRIAGLLPQGKTVRDVLANRMMEVFDTLSPEGQEQLVYIGIGLQDRERKKAEERASKETGARRATSPLKP